MVWRRTDEASQSATRCVSFIDDYNDNMITVMMIIMITAIMIIMKTVMMMIKTMIQGGPS